MKADLLERSLAKPGTIVALVIAAGMAATAVSHLGSIGPERAGLQSGSAARPIQASAPRQDGLVAPLSGEYCQYNAKAEVRVCVDLSSRARRRDVKGSDGNWYPVESD